MIKFGGNPFTKLMRDYLIPEDDKCKIKLTHDCVISLNSYVTDSLKNTIISRVDGIPPKNDIIIDPSDCNTVDVNISLTTPIRCADFLSSIEDTTNQTVVVFTSKKHCTTLFNKNNVLFDMNLLKNTIPYYMVSSTLEAIYTNIEKSWISINKGDESNFTNVMYIPNIYVFRDDTMKTMITSPYMINLLVVAVPRLSDMFEGVSEPVVEDGIKYVLDNTINAAIRCGCKNLIIDPFSYKLFSKNLPYTASLWYDFIGQQNVIEAIDKIDFTILDTNLYRLFYSSNPLK